MAVSPLSNSIQLGFRTGFTRVSDGNMSYRFGTKEEVYANRRRYFEAAGVPAEKLLTFFTDHKDEITDWPGGAISLNALRSEALATTDAIVTCTPETGIFLTFADCVPLVLYDRRQHLMAFAHIGWRSMAVNFASKLVAHLTDRYGSRPEWLQAVVGPCIKPESYLFKDPIQARDPQWRPFLREQVDGRWGIDLPGFLFAELGKAGLKQEAIDMSTVDTARDEEMFSHYAATEGGRPEKQGRIIFWGWLDRRA